MEMIRSLTGTCHHGRGPLEGRNASKLPEASAREFSADNPVAKAKRLYGGPSILLSGLPYKETFPRAPRKEPSRFTT